MSTTDPAGPSRPRSPRGQGERLRREVLEAVNRVLARDGGEEKLTMRAIAREVGVAPPSIYLHFSDKADLVWAALSDKYDQLAIRMRDADLAAGRERDVSDDPAVRARRRLRAQLHAYLRFAAENPGHYRLMFEIRQPAVDPGRVAGHPARVVGRSLREGVLACEDAGATLRLPRRQLAHTLWSGLHGFVSLNRALAVDEAGDDVATWVDDLLDALLVAPATGEGPPEPTRVESVITRLTDPGED